MVVERLGLPSIDLPAAPKVDENWLKMHQSAFFILKVSYIIHFYKNILASFFDGVNYGFRLKYSSFSSISYLLNVINLDFKIYVGKIHASVVLKGK